MSNNITNEDIISYLDKECEESLKLKIEEAIKNDESIKERYNELKNLRMLQAETMLPLLNKQMPESTAKIINSLKEKKTSYISNFFKLSPIAIIGWLGFASVGTIQVANLSEPTASITMASLEFDKDIKLRSAKSREDIENIIIQLEDDLLLERKKLKNFDSDSIDLRGDKNKAMEAFSPAPKTKYRIIINNITQNDNDVCVELEILEDGLSFDDKEICFQQK